MSNYLGDFPEDSTVYIPFNTFSSNDPQASATITNLADADIKVHKDAGLTQIAVDGATVAIDFDTITGNHLITIDTSASADYAVGSDYMVRIEGTTVDAGTINAWVGSFSIENRFNEVDVVSLAGVVQSLIDLKDFADAGYDPATNKVQGVVLVDTTTTNTDMVGTDNALLAASINLTGGAVDTVTTLTNKTGFSLSTAGILAIWDQLTSALTTASTIGKLLVDNINATISSRMATTHINATAGKVDNVATVDTTTTNTDMRGTDGANTTVPDAAGTAPTAVEIRQEMDSNSTQLNTTLPGLIDDLAIKKNTAFSNFEFLMVLTSDHVTPATGLTVTGQRSIDGGAFASVSGSIAEVSNGIYQFDALAADTNGDVITWRFSEATADDTFITFKTVA